MVDTVLDFTPPLAIADAEGLECASDGRIVLEGLPNTRDLGGIPASDGRVVASARLIRSGALDRATERDLRTLLDEYRVRTVIDLRTEEERREHPDPEDAMEGVRFVNDPVLDTAALGVTREGGLLGALKALRALKKNPAGVMEDVYERLILDEKSQRGYARFFDDVLAAGANEGAVLWHCTVGKDRAGLAAALLLHALGVPRDVVMADYLATNRHVASHAQDIADALAAHGLAGKFDEGIRVLNSADPAFSRRRSRLPSAPSAALTTTCAMPFASRTRSAPTCATAISCAPRDRRTQCVLPSVSRVRASQPSTSARVGHWRLGASSLRAFARM